VPNKNEKKSDYTPTLKKHAFFLRFSERCALHPSNRMGLISDEERQNIQSTIGSRQTVIACAVVKLHLASPDPKAMQKLSPNSPSVLRKFPNLSEERWTPTSIMGACAFIIDRSNDSFLFQVMNLKSFETLFMYELYEDIKYEVLGPQFHAFEMDDCVAGLCFSDPGESKVFLSKVMALRPTTQVDAGANLLNGNGKKKGFFGGFFGGSRKSRGDDDIKIGAITQVSHNQHVGLNQDGTFDMQNLPAQWKVMFKQAGIKKRDLQNPETAGIIFKTIQQEEYKQEIVQIYEQDPEYHDYESEEMEDYVAENISQEQLDEYERYQEELRQYYEELEAYEAEQRALEAWEKEQAASVVQYEEVDIEPPPLPSRKVKTSSKVPPPLPDRKAKDLDDKSEQVRRLEKEAQVQVKAAEKVAKEAEKQRSMAAKNFRKSMKRVEKNPEQEKYERAAAEAKRLADEASKAAEEAARERDLIMKEVEELRRQNQQLKEAPPPVPIAIPPPPPPPLPAMLRAPAPPKLPQLPKKSILPPGTVPKTGMLAGIGGVNLRKAPPKVPKPVSNTDAMLNTIQNGVKLKAPPPKKRPTSALPDLKDMKPKAQNALMSKLIQTMNERRINVADDDDDDSEGEWSD